MRSVYRPYVIPLARTLSANLAVDLSTPAAEASDERQVHISTSVYSFMQRKSELGERQDIA